MTPFTKNLIIFLVINFAALGIGGFLMGEGPSSDYYQTVNKAPWTPPGWVFGAAWTTIMICFSIYMAYWTDSENDNTVLALFAVQFILNVGWNPLFFNFHEIVHHFRLNCHCVTFRKIILCFPKRFIN